MPELPQVQARMATITPEMAETLLQRNKRNRGVSSARIEQYAGDMRRGEWQLNGEAIKVSRDGQILDGQHRLLAIIEADAAVQTLLITGLEPEVQETMDQGRSRTFGDVLKIRGEQDYYNLAAATRIVCLYERDHVPFKDPAKPAPTVKQLSRTLERNSGIRDSVKFAAKHRRGWMVVSAIAALHYLFSIVSEDDANDFVQKLAGGENLDSTSPIYVLRERLIADHYSDEPLSITLKVKLAFVIRAWNAYQDGEAIRRLVWTAGGAHPDRFPQIRGLAGRDDAETQEAA